jgi:hypothetical protein
MIDLHPRFKSSRSVAKPCFLETAVCPEINPIPLNQRPFFHPSIALIGNFGLLTLLLFPFWSSAQTTHKELVHIIRSQDSLLFDVGFNTCDVSQFERLLSDDFEFYHDKSGLTPTKAAFVAGIRDGLCTNPYHPLRKLVPGSETIYPLYDGATLYGAIQVAKHKFYEQVDGIPQFRSVARFDHLWLLENGEWKLKRSLSYDHQTREGDKDGKNML